MPPSPQKSYRVSPFCWICRPPNPPSRCREQLTDGPGSPIAATTCDEHTWRTAQTLTSTPVCDNVGDTHASGEGREHVQVLGLERDAGGEVEGHLALPLQGRRVRTRAGVASGGGAESEPERGEKPDACWLGAAFAESAHITEGGR